MAQSRNKAKDAELIRFVTPPNTKALYKEVAELEGLHFDTWIRETLHAEARRILEAQGRDTSAMPDIHLKLPPRLQPRLGEEDTWKKKKKER